LKLKAAQADPCPVQRLQQSAAVDVLDSAKYFSPFSSTPGMDEQAWPAAWPNTTTTRAHLNML
jgi:hypothetical protein